MTPHHHVFQRRHVCKQANILKSAGDTGLGNQMHGFWCVLFARQLKTATVRRVKPGQHIEKSGFASPVGANQAINLTTLDLDAHIAECLHATKALGHASNVEYRVAQGA
jgi:hypothetical protein